MIAALDTQVRQRVFERDGYRCVRCGKTEGLQAAHILPKGHYPRLRFELDNILSLDVGCHLYWAHKDPLGFTEFINTKYPGLAERLQVMDRMAPKANIKELYANLCNPRLQQAIKEQDRKEADLRDALLPQETHGEL